MSILFFYKNRDEKSETGPVWKVGTLGKGQQIGVGG
jgi:hypothetical protein